MKVKIAVVIVVLIGLLHLSSCSAPESALIGKWREIDRTEIIEFFKDGTIGVSSNSLEPMVGKYSFVDDKRIKLELGVVIRIMKVEISGNDLTLTDQRDKVSKYQRVTD